MPLNNGTEAASCSGWCGETEDRETGISEGAVNGEKRRDGAGKLKIARHKENGKYPPQKERKKKKKTK